MHLCFAARTRLSAAALAFAIALPALAQGPRQQLTPEQTKALIEKREAIEQALRHFRLI